MVKTNTLKATALILAGFFFFASCSSTTLIQSTPSGAKVYLNEEMVGTTPYPHTDTRIVGSTTMLRLEKEGYETLHTSFSRDEAVDIGAIIGGCFLWIPFLWTMKYNPVHNYELVEKQKGTDYTNNATLSVKSAAEKLRELKQLLDEKLISQEEYDTAKAKILNE
ncbi:MAG: PEGA domain-containing protein [Candidatus Limimorpha sp.]